MLSNKLLILFVILSVSQFLTSYHKTKKEFYDEGKIWAKNNCEVTQSVKILPLAPIVDNNFYHHSFLYLRSCILFTFYKFNN